MKNRSLFISDVHGQVGALKALLAKVNYQPLTDQLVLLGDYVGQSADNLACLHYIVDLTQRTGAVALMGNHDLSLWQCLRRGRQAAPAKSFHYPYTASLAAAIRRRHPELVDFLGSLRWWYEDKHTVAVHAGFDPSLEDWRQSSLQDFTSIRQPFLSAPLTLKQTVIFGHTPCMSLHGSADVWFGSGKIGIDGGASKARQLNCLVLDAQGFSSLSVAVREVRTEN